MTSTCTSDDQTRVLEWKEWLSALQSDLAQRQLALDAERVQLEGELRALGVTADDPIQAVVDGLSADERAACMAELGLDASADLQASAGAVPAVTRTRARRDFL